MDGVKVYPLEPVSEQTIKLSLCDAYSPKVWVTQTNFWPLGVNVHSAQRAYDILKEGLARTLHEIPALGGTIQQLSDDPRDLAILVDHDAHVEFAFEDLSATANVPKYADLKSAGFPLQDLVAPFSQPITLMPVCAGSRMLTAKLNKIEGGLALSLAFNHLLTDAASVAEVEKIWSQHCADVSVSGKGSYSAALPASDIRGRLSTPVPDAGSFADEHWNVFPTEKSQLYLPNTAVTKEAAMTVLQQTKAKLMSSLKDQGEETKWSIWHFGTEDLVKLKKDASGPDATKWISSMDALIGLFWSRLSLVKQRSKSGHEKSTATFPINIRSRLSPPIDAQYIGNCVDLIMVENSLTELEGEDTGLVAAARALRGGVTGWKESKWADWLSMAAALPNDQAICPNPLVLLESQNLGCNDYSKSQSHTLNWGPELGKIDSLRYMKPAASLANCATVVIVHPRLACGGLEVSTTINDDIRACLASDPVFSTYAKFVCTYT